ncbi:MAG TPA: sigma-70 family RNA polymerase sigma factor [Planctomycetota bacterium]|jgi:RNA polymerase sigma-70 factor (ECF subfamily)|nr:sigma-70 family RNA polymerase sigma factor [Planctomycetota bacterium]
MTRGAELRAPEAILERNLEWIRALARSLARDEADADDLVQDACVAALESAPETVERPRRWLATVVGNLWRESGRSRERRRARDTDAFRGDRTRDDIVEQVQVFREVAECVVALHEPYRTAVLMRFWEGLPPRAIAARLGTTPATVQNRIARGLALLRERLDAARGGRATWLAALLPWVERPAAPTALSIGGLVVNAKLVLASLSLVVAAGALLVWAQRDGGPEVVARAPAPAEAQAHEPLAAPNAPALAPASPEIRRELATSPAVAPASAAPAAEKTAWTIRGRVLDVEGVPLPGIPLGAGGGGPAITSSGAGGKFELATTERDVRLASADPAWTTVRSAAWRPDSESEPLVVVARSIDVQGRVQDANGEGLASARIRFAMPPGFEARFDKPLEGSVSMSWSATSGPDGAFSIRGMPSIPGATLSAVLEGFARSEVPAPVGPADPAVIVLARPARPVTGRVAGRVLDDQGNPVPTARVFLGLASVTTDAKGEFALDVARAVSTDRIVAVKAGWLPAILERTREPRGEDTGWPALVELVLPGPVLSIRGRVVDKKGDPVAGLRVSIADPTPIGTIGQMPVHAEFLGAGSPIPAAALETESRMPSADGDNFNDYYMRVGAPSAFFHFATTGADGSFELGGLADKRYRLRLQEPKTCAFSTTEELRAGAPPARIEWLAPPLWERVAGTVVDDEDRPVAGALVSLEREAFGVRTRVFGGRVYVTMRDPRERVATDADGHFEFRDVPSEGMGVQVRGESVVPDEFLLAKVSAPGAVKIAVHQRCKFEVVVVSGGFAADELALQDVHGAQVDVLRMDLESVNAYSSAAITDGRSGVLSASSAAKTLVLKKDGVVVKTVPLQLRGGEVTRIQV